MRLWGAAAPGQPLALSYITARRDCGASCAIRGTRVKYLGRPCHEAGMTPDISHLRLLPTFVACDMSCRRTALQRLRRQELHYPVAFDKAHGRASRWKCRPAPPQRQPYRHRRLHLA